MLRRNADDVSPVGILSLATYLRFWGWTYLAVTLAVAALKHEVNFRAPAGAQTPEPLTFPHLMYACSRKGMSPVACVRWAWD
jgi:hypothetical protein